MELNKGNWGIESIWIIVIVIILFGILLFIFQKKQRVYYKIIGFFTIYSALFLLECVIMAFFANNPIGFTERNPFLINSILILNVPLSLVPIIFFRLQNEKT